MLNKSNKFLGFSKQRETCQLKKKQKKTEDDEDDSLKLLQIDFG